LKRKKIADLSDGELADRWGVTKTRLDDADAEIEELKGEFNARKLEFALGALWKVFKDVEGTTRLDTKAIRTAQGAAWCKTFEKAGTRTSYPVRPVEVVTAEACA